MDASTKYDINFFKPHTPFLKNATRLIWIGLIIWFMATYGFHILLKVLETPTPESGYLIYEKIYPKLTDGSASSDELVDIGNVYLGLAGKSVALQTNTSLKKAFTSTVYTLLPANQRKQLLFTAKEADTNKKVDTGFIEKALGLEKSNPAMIAAIPYALTAIEEGDVSMVSSEIPAIMSRNLIHNQSILTDTIILGFPFHYFYSALFLLALFVTICVVYCRAIDKVMAKYGLEKTFE